ncbi:hypothetical protein A2U01_0029940, partial [Trifolium medium]|nr:hypothetical protein [Trifolium medium]
QYISSNGGVVAAEELAPYLDIESTEKIKRVVRRKDRLSSPIYLVTAGSPPITPVLTVSFDMVSTGTFYKGYKELLAVFFTLSLIGLPCLACILLNASTRTHDYYIASRSL